MDWLSLSLLCAFALASADAATKAWLRHYPDFRYSTLPGAILAPF